MVGWYTGAAVVGRVRRCGVCVVYVTVRWVVIGADG